MVILHRHDHFIPGSHEKDLLLRIREASPLGDEGIGQSEYALLCVHGAVTPSVVFDAPGENTSWINFFARQGIPSFALDLRGYGRSTKPKGMYTPVEESPFDCDHQHALRDIHDAVSFIQRQVNVKKIVLLGLSWGSLLVGMYASQYPKCVHSLVLLGPVYCYQNPLWASLMDPHHPENLHPAVTGYRIITQSMLRGMWHFEIPSDRHHHLQDDDVLQSIESEMLQSDLAWSHDHAPGCLRVPNGVLQDVAKMYNGHAFYKPEDIVVPTLILRGDYDQSSHPKDMEGLFTRLSSTQKYYYTLGHASHYALIERNAPFMMELVLHFLKHVSTTPSGI